MIKKIVCLNMIAKNESAVIRRCLESVKHFIDYWVIVDTGSTDGTQKIISECLKEIPGDLHERKWVNFAHNRNEALSLAKNKCDYLLFIDADETLVFQKSFPILEKDYYACAYHHGTLISQRILLVNANLDWAWRGAVHEQPECEAAQDGEFSSHVYIQASKEGHRSKDLQEKFRSDAAILQSLIEKDPLDCRNVFQLAGCYQAAEEDELALKFFTQRAKMGGDELEMFVSLYRMGIIQHKLSRPSEQFIHSFVQAYLLRPTRTEPLYYLADYYMSIGCYILGYLISKHALSLPPNRDYFLNQFAIDEYGLLLQFAECAYRIQAFKEFGSALDKLLSKNLPENVHTKCEKLRSEYENDRHCHI
jgi:glycosyltransferase involved in cell wall biosynthesis